MLKRLLFVAALGLTCSPPAAAADEAASPLLVGSVRDQTGRALAAEIAAYTSEGRVAGRDRSAADGTFALLLDAKAASLTVTCDHCAPFRRELGGDTPLALIVTRYRALDRTGPDESDLQSLPYYDVGEAAGLARFVIPITSGERVASLSDRGLERGRGSILDGGANVYDPTTGEGDLYAFPGRSAGAVRIARASRAFVYGGYAGGGAFAFDRFGEEPKNGAVLDFGAATALEATAHAAGLLSGIAGSRDGDGVARRRGDIGWSGLYAGGTLRAEVSVASQRPDDLSIAEQRSRELASFGYATATRLSRTFLGFSALADRGDFFLRPGGALWGSSSSSLEADVRVEHPAAVELAFGGTLRAATGKFNIASSVFRAATYANALGFVEASHAGPLSYDAGITIARISILPGYNDGARATATFILPAISGSAELGGGFRASVGVSASARAPTLLELPTMPGPNPYSIERGNLTEASLSYDDAKRFECEATGYRQQLAGLGARTLNGVGIGCAWQVTPRLSLRAWTLHDSAADTGTNLLIAPYAVLTGPSLERGVIWASWEGPRGMRADAIYRQSSLTGSSGASIDASLVVPLTRTLGISAGSAARATVRRSYLGLRFQNT